SSRRRHTRSDRDWSSDVCSSDLRAIQKQQGTAAWYNPAKSYSRSEWGERVLPDTVYLGESNPYRPLWDEPVLDMGKFREARTARSEEHTSELQSRSDLVCRRLLE